MSSQPGTLQPLRAVTGRRVLVLATVLLSAVVMLLLLAASLGQAAGPGSLLPVPLGGGATTGGRASPGEARDAVGVPASASAVTITNPAIIESSAYLSATGTTLYYGNNMPSGQVFSLEGDTAGTNPDYLECTAAFEEGPFTDDNLNNGWKCGDYEVVYTDTVDGIITATLYSTNGIVLTDTETFFYFRDVVSPTSAATSPAFTDTAPIPVSWNATDDGSGLDETCLWYQLDDEGWQQASVSCASGTSGTFLFTPPGPHGGRNGTYYFQTIATDNVSNVETGPADPGDDSTVYEVHYVFLPAVAKLSLANGGFESAWESWTHGGPLPQTISSADRHSGSFSARLGNPSYECRGGVPMGTAWIERTISVPSSGPSTLRIWYRIYSQDKFDGDKYDRFEIWVNGSRVLIDGNQSSVFGCGNPTQSQGWESHDVDVSSYAGQDIPLRLVNRSHFDNWYNTWTYVDDISY